MGVDAAEGKRGGKARAKRVAKIVTAALLCFLPSLLVRLDLYSWILVVLWAAGLFLFARAAGASFQPPSRRGLALPLILIALSVSVRLACLNPLRGHYDEFLAAYISSRIHLFETNFFAVMPPENWFWYQYPPPFFFLQNLLLKPLGETLYSVKLSGIPYALGSSIAVWLLARTLFDKGTALIAIAVYAFFAPALYIDTIAMLSVATTCAFGWAIYLLTRLFKSGKAADAYFAGIGCAGCYFLVHSGFIAFPLALFVFAMKWRDRGWKWSENARWFLTGFAATLAPFLAWALPSRLYFLRRFSQVSLLGSLSTVTPSVHSFRDFGVALSNQFAQVFLSLFRAGIGGAGRYSFGHLAFFDPVTLVLLLLGLGAIGWRIRQRETILVILVLGLIGQFLAMALSDPPPAFHRFCGAHTLLCVVIALGLRTVQSMVTKFSRSRRAALVTVTLALVLFAVSSFSHFQRMIKIDGPEQSVRLGLYIAEKFPGRQIYIAGFPTLHLQRVFHFIPGVRIPPERQSIPEVFVRRLRSDPAATREKYLYVLLGPQRLYPMFKAADPQGSLVEFDNDHEYGLFVNY